MIPSIASSISAIDRHMRSCMPGWARPSSGRSWNDPTSRSERSVLRSTSCPFAYAASSAGATGSWGSGRRTGCPWRSSPSSGRGARGTRPCPRPRPGRPAAKTFAERRTPCAPEAHCARAGDRAGPEELTPLHEAPPLASPVRRARAKANAVPPASTPFDTPPVGATGSRDRAGRAGSSRVLVALHPDVVGARAAGSCTCG